MQHNKSHITSYRQHQETEVGEPKGSVMFWFLSTQHMHYTQHRETEVGALHRLGSAQTPLNTNATHQPASLTHSLQLFHTTPPPSTPLTPITPKIKPPWADLHTWSWNLSSSRAQQRVWWAGPHPRRWRGWEGSEGRSGCQGSSCTGPHLARWRPCCWSGTRWCTGAEWPRQLPRDWAGSPPGAWSWPSLPRLCPGHPPAVDTPASVSGASPLSQYSQLSTLTLTSVFLTSPPGLWLLQYHVKDHGHSAKSTGCRFRLNMHAPYACGFACSDMTWSMVVWCTQNVRRDGSGFMWHQPCNNQAALYVHHLGGYSKCAI